MKFAIVDIETTGGNSIRNKITEIAIYIHDGEKIIDQFVSLVNPECPIAPFISNLTGITNEMVEDAPKFYEIAKDIVTLTDGAVFVAHNAQFDYGFIREEYKSLGYNYSRDYLCTVKLSRKVLPGFASYSLGNLCQNLGISIANRHRASGDALATVKLFEMILGRDPDQEIIKTFTKNDYLHLRFPVGFDHKILDNIPEKPGVYYFHNEDGTTVYVGKSNNIRKRVLSHFSNKQSKKAIELRNSIKDISFEETGNELIALLLESEEIKKIQPVFNRMQKRTTFNYGIFSTINEAGYITLFSAKVKNLDDALITAGSYDEAEMILQKIQNKNNLCQKLCGTKDIKHACFGYSVRMCNGACIGKESADEYNIRAQAALDSIQYSHQNFMIIGSGRHHSEKSVTHIESGRYIGFGYFEPEFVNAHPEILREHVKPRTDNRDVQRIIRHFLNTASPSNILTY
ncbi:MAG TPA: exonuclease domain-containing protein [Bacteroidia bacterium]|nr:GIY-YIG nuclease family protein [Bacteroidota bacterium]MBP9789685.1 GIY-YIG nuclease family protein [Bacteroidia bacterium]MBK7429833.1 GIY-YIG nuclease family protein [Bacteroidota bacterium]MBK7572167.1 GIY-YIG nuclease family protein [Bacteroidota bacterium]MBP9922258.1 GIY-YIG nuclease family protein [Bacteroidia bacterium]